MPARSRRGARAPAISGGDGSARWRWTRHLTAALRYVSLSPVRARSVARAQDWRWASTRAHLRGKDDGVTVLKSTHDRFPQFADLLATEPECDLFATLRSAESISRPLGDDRFLARTERQTGRILKPAKRGPKPATEENG